MKSSQEEEKVWIGNFILWGPTWKDVPLREAEPSPNGRSPSRTRRRLAKPYRIETPTRRNPPTRVKPFPTRQRHPLSRRAPHRSHVRCASTSTPRATANHYRLAHGAAVPPVDIDGSNEKACPFCLRTFPSTRLCSQHIREQHMREASEKRAREAVEKERQRGSAMAHTKWGEAEIAQFKEALARLGPRNNAALASAVGTRDKQQITTFKSRFLKDNPTWLEENHHPAQPTATTSTLPEPCQHPGTLSDSQHHPIASHRKHPGQTTEETAQRLEKLDRALSLLRPNPVTQWEPEPRERQPPAPDGRGVIRPAAPHAYASTHTYQHTHTPAPSRCDGPVLPGARDTCTCTQSLPLHVGLVRNRHNKILNRLANAVPPSKGIKNQEQVVPGDTHEPQVPRGNESR
ncbi:hypothetical protein EMCRGX_G005307 [Ephydatia muelleri]